MDDEVLDDDGDGEGANLFRCVDKHDPPARHPTKEDIINIERRGPRQPFAVRGLSGHTESDRERKDRRNRSARLRNMK